MMFSGLSLFLCLPSYPEYMTLLVSKWCEKDYHYKYSKGRMNRYCIIIVNKIKFLLGILFILVFYV